MNKLIIIGAGGHARSAVDVIESEGKHEIVGFIDNSIAPGTKFCGYSILGSDEDLPDMITRSEHALIGIGQISDPELRKNLFLNLKKIGFQLPSVISPRALVVKKTMIGEGTIIMHGAIINSKARIGANCIINTGAIIEHDVIVGNHCHISTGVIINGSTKIGDSCFIGSGSVLRNNITLGNRCIVGMGSRVLKDLVDSSEYKG